jgi:hypothetical protein
MTDPTPLSPTAQAIVTAFDDKYENCGQWDDDWQEQCLAAALRAVADQVAPKCATATTADYRAGANNERIMARSQLLAIAAELEGSNA